MPVDPQARVYMTAMADAIRGKLGTTDLIKGKDFANKILSIPMESGLIPQVKVTTMAGATVTAKQGDITRQGIASAAGECVLLLPQIGPWQILVDKEGYQRGIGNIVLVSTYQAFLGTDARTSLSADEALEGKTFMNAMGEIITGTMKDQGAFDVTLDGVEKLQEEKGAGYYSKAKATFDDGPATKLIDDL